MDVAFLHGFGASPFTWRRLTPLLDRSHRLLVLDRPWTDPTVAADATVASLDAAGTHSTVLVGHSAGAEIGMLVALSYPDRVAGLVLIAPVLDGGPPAVARAVARLPGMGVIAPPLLRAGIRIGFGAALRSAWSDTSALTPEVIEGYRAPLLQPEVAESLWAMTRTYRPLRLAPRVADLSCPVLVMVGADDRWATAIEDPAVRTIRLDRCGHLPHEEQPRQVADALSDYLHHPPPLGPARPTATGHHRDEGLPGPGR